MLGKLLKMLAGGSSQSKEQLEPFPQDSMNQGRILTFNNMTFEFDDLVVKANNGDTVAMGMLGDAYNTGIHGIEKDKKLAMQYYERVSDADIPGALFKVGLEYLEGGYYKTSERLAAKYLKKAADKGYMDAQYFYGCLLRGKNKIREASRYFELASTQGQKEAQLALGEYFFFDAQDIDSAIYWICHSNMRGNPQAGAMLDEMIQRGVPRAYERIQDTYARIRPEYKQLHSEQNIPPQSAQEEPEQSLEDFIKEVAEAFAED